MAQSRRIVWLNVVTVLSAAILIGAEVFGAAFAGSWAIATLFDLGGFGAAHPRRTASCSAASPSWCSSSVTRTASSRSPRAGERVAGATRFEKVKEDLRGEN